MTVKELLDSHRKIDRSIDMKLEEIAQLRALAERCTRRITDSGGTAGTVSDKVGSNAVKIAMLENRIDEEIDRLVDLKEAIMSVASALDDESERLVVERHYILHESIDAISEKIGRTPRHTFRMLRSALGHLEQIWENGRDVKENLDKSE